MSMHRYIAAVLISVSLAVALAVPTGAAGRRTPRITLVYATAETTTSALVAWNTNVATDSRLQYSTTYPIPASAPTLYSASQVTYHEFELTGLTPGTLYYYRVTSCAKRECATATDSFETYPSCPDIVPPVTGTWQREVTPNVGEPAEFEQELRGIAAVSQNDVWAVGWSREPGGPLYVKRPLIEHFDGSTWNIVPSPYPPSDTQTELHGVSATSANDAWAVGTTHDGMFPSRTLIQHWDGTQWTIVPSPNPGDQVNALLGVAALSATDVWAVGYWFGTGSEANIDTLILHWDGIGWSQVPSPNIAGVANQLAGVTAISSSDIWAVGTAGGAPLAMHWNGIAWTITPMRFRSGLSSENLLAVSGAASNDVWAVGLGRGFFSNRASGTIRHWDGTRWTDRVCRAFSSSNPPQDYEGGGPDFYFTGVSAAATNDVWAVGASGSGPMIFHWDGFAWTTVTHPRAYPNTVTLSAVATLQDGGAWSAGREFVQEGTSGVFHPPRTLVYRYP
ncbi:MAG TPA: fibronectin type III domain-containing protein [Vicinamibacterales bacterium]|nr:fibronectin type III domain-containing protein [Vicinamibacterales bacterium]